ncbi:hypothetical protein BCV70DRAFT_201125 [Testicularia cyperi]|uniref:Uncharacterized protein n=1 Tax=Testicularia cyperi TaxID=1882483 RepID=A0A317XMQ7_9BASI|nr:hypothetical protein BCV70DRAFT_201125 [Testicularia cyperi]
MTTNDEKKPAARIYTPLLQPEAVQPWSQYAIGNAFQQPSRPGVCKQGLLSNTAYAVLRDNFRISTWMALGSCVQAAAVCVFGASLWVLVLPLGVVLYKLLRVVLEVYGIIPNAHMAGVIPGLATCFIPNDEGEYTGSPSSHNLAVLLITARCNHPLGMLAPGFKEMGQYFASIVDWCETDSTAKGFLGMTQWLNAADRRTSNELLAIGYFRRVEDIHRLAHDVIHKQAWKFWNTRNYRLGYISISHEIFNAPPGNWECIYGNSKPAGLGSTVFQSSKDGLWRSPLVRVKGPLRSSAGRLDAKQSTEQHQHMEQIYHETDTYKAYPEFAQDN